MTCSLLSGWEIHLDDWDDRLLEFSSGTRLLLDPDEVTARQLRVLRERGVFAIAWLNVGYREPGRSFSAHLEHRILHLSGKTPRDPRYPVRFFSAVWKRVLTQRMQELTNLGFRGFFVTGLDAAVRITDHPFAIEEMVSLCRDLKHLATGLTQNAWFMIDVPEDMKVQVSHFDFSDAICLKGLWHTDPRRRSRPWERRVHLGKWLSRGGPPLYTIDFAPAGAREALTREITALGADPAFATLPLHPIRSRLP